AGTTDRDCQPTRICDRFVKSTSSVTDLCARSSTTPPENQRTSPIRQIDHRLNTCLRITLFQQQYPVIPLATRSCRGVGFQHVAGLCRHVIIQINPVRIAESVFELHAISPPDDPGPADCDPTVCE